ncbi:hypothetical protein CZ771_04360 [Actinomycetales bacterium JB111]|nr:hypothetical protein CZ771_04360 [Actinomycetales bacterium JB111]
MAGCPEPVSAPRHSRGHSRRGAFTARTSRPHAVGAAPFGRDTR